MTEYAKVKADDAPLTSQCKHWQPLWPTLGVCKKGHFLSKTVTTNVCATCNDYDGPQRGIGDKVHKVIKKITGGKLKGCGGCGKRRAKLNDLGKKK